MSDECEKRRLFAIVNKEMHHRYVGLMVLTVVVVSVIMTGSIFLSSLDTINLLKQLAAGNEGLIASLQATHRSSLLRVIIALLFIVIAVAVVGTIEMSKIAGPLYRMSETAGKIADGDYSVSFRIRSRDIPQELADSFGRMIDSIREKTKKHADELDAVCSNLKGISAQIQEDKAERDSSKVVDEAISTLSDISSRDRMLTEPKI